MICRPGLCLFVVGVAVDSAVVDERELLSATKTTATDAAAEAGWVKDGQMDPHHYVTGVEWPVAAGTAGSRGARRGVDVHRQRRGFVSTKQPAHKECAYCGYSCNCWRCYTVKSDQHKHSKQINIFTDLLRLRFSCPLTAETLDDKLSPSSTIAGNTSSFIFTPTDTHNWKIWQEAQLSLTNRPTLLPSGEWLQFTGRFSDYCLPLSHLTPSTW